MSESQFAYSGFTLDELRSLAASPQVGTMQAMPQSFRALADRVGEVADLLSHAQADLPNWWKGPAAEQAAATLGRAAAEAREFHDSAMGAASAVSRCAQVVAEQQNQMMNVPDVQEPGVSAVVQRPTTPFEALEAARQDASYQAAHEQAVQVVNGIAAQYVETQSQLAMVVTPRGEDFDLSGTQNQSAGAAAEHPSEGSLPLNESPATGTPQSYGGKTLQHPLEIQERKTLAADVRPERAPLTVTDSSARELHVQNSGQPHSEFSSNKSARPTTPENEASHDSSPCIKPAASNAVATQDHELEFFEPVSQLTTMGPAPLTTPHNTYGRVETSIDRGNKNRPAKLASSVPERDLIGNSEGNRHASISPDTDYPAGSVASEAKTTGPQLPYNSRLDDANSSNASLFPPYSGIGPVHRGQQERNQRPSYLKERKSAWLTETVAVPPDGIIMPDWLE